MECYHLLDMYLIKPENGECPQHFQSSKMLEQYFAVAENTAKPLENSAEAENMTEPLDNSAHK